MKSTFTRIQGLEKGSKSITKTKAVGQAHWIPGGKKKNHRDPGLRRSSFRMWEPFSGQGEKK